TSVVAAVTQIRCTIYRNTLGEIQINRLRNLAIILALLLMTLMPSPTRAAELTPFKIGISEAVNTVLPLWMAEAGGFYRAQGLKVEIINMQGGSRGAQELQAGRIDAMHVGLSSVVRLNRAGG